MFIGENLDFVSYWETVIKMSAPHPFRQAPTCRVRNIRMNGYLNRLDLTCIRGDKHLPVPVP